VTNNVEQLSCQELVELVTDYLEGALPENQRRRFDEHLATCDGCGAYVDQIRQTIRVTGELGVDGLSSEAERALLGAFRNWKKS
jgi:anti-sigma factor RsiW